VDVHALQASPIGQLVPISGTDGRTGRPYDYWAFLADPLPRSIQLSTTTWRIVAQAEAELGRLDQAARQIPNPSLLRQPALRREAQSTSALEGTFAPLEEVLESDVDQRAGMSLEIREILNYVVAAEQAFSWVMERPLTAGLMEGVQQVLVHGTPSEFSDAGRIRDRHVFIGPKDAPIEQARFVPAPYGDQLRAGVEDWIRWVNGPPSDLPAVVQAGLAHYQFETLHPFSDGNGRIGRLVIVLQLMRKRVLRDPILVVSPWFEARRLEYQDALLALSQSGDWNAWIDFFASGVAASAATTHQRVDGLISWQQDALARVRAEGIAGVAERLAGELIGSPIMRASQVSRRHGVSHQAAMNALRRLAQVGLVTEQRRRGGISFTAQPVVKLIGG
jgi:Fic family protein